jgi:hypothetical protein
VTGWKAGSEGVSTAWVAQLADLLGGRVRSKCLGAANGLENGGELGKTGRQEGRTGGGEGGRGGGAERTLPGGEGGLTVWGGSCAV